MKFKQNIECKQNRYGETPAAYITGSDATLQKIHDAIWENGLGGMGYKFAMVFDVSNDEYEEPPKEAELYFLDDLLEEVIEYVGVEKVRELLDEKCNRKE